jgi:hypothetical protein
MTLHVDASRHHQLTRRVDLAGAHRDIRSQRDDPTVVHADIGTKYSSRCDHGAVADGQVQQCSEATLRCFSDGAITP